MPIEPVPKTPAVSQPPEATAQEDVRERRLSRDSRRNRRRKGEDEGQASDQPRANGHIDTLA